MAISTPPTLRTATHGRKIHQFPKPADPGVFGGDTIELLTEADQIEVAERKLSDKITSLRAELASAEQEDAKDAGAAARGSSGDGSSRQPSAPAIRKKLDKSVAELTATRAAKETVHAELALSMSADVASGYAVKKARDGASSALVEAISRVESATLALAKVQRQYDTFAYLDDVANGRIPRGGHAVGLKAKLDGAEVPPVKMLLAVKDALDAAISREED